MKTPTLAVLLCAAGAQAFVGTPMGQLKAGSTRAGESQRVREQQQQHTKNVFGTAKPVAPRA